MKANELAPHCGNYAEIEQRLVRAEARRIMYSYGIWGMTLDDITSRLMEAVWQTEEKWAALGSAEDRTKFLRGVFRNVRKRILEESMANLRSINPALYQAKAERAASLSAGLEATDGEFAARLAALDGRLRGELAAHGSLAAERARTILRVRRTLAQLDPADLALCVAFMGRDERERDEGASITLAADRLGHKVSTFYRHHWKPMAERFRKKFFEDSGKKVP